ncbi:MAG: YsnF/AvaK domain-containing protein [Steroidobacteraceae bacterium]
MTSRKIVAVFDSQSAAQSARNSLLELGLDREQISITDQSSSEQAVRTPEARGSFWAHIKEMFMPDRDRYTIEESMRRGGCVLVATADDDQADEAIARLERAGAVNLDERESEWAAGQTDEGARIPVVEEQLRVGKREVNRGSVRVRSYIVEEPVHEEVRLREERVDVERRPVNSPARPVAKGSPEDLLQERTVEVSETAEQAVVGKEARITEEVVVSKNANERVQQIDETVRRTKVEVEDGRDTGPTGKPPEAKTTSPQRPARS